MRELKHAHWTLRIAGRVYEVGTHVSTGKAKHMTKACKRVAKI